MMRCKKNKILYLFYFFTASLLLSCNSEIKDKTDYSVLLEKSFNLNQEIDESGFLALNECVFFTETEAFYEGIAKINYTTVYELGMPYGGALKKIFLKEGSFLNPVDTIAVLENQTFLEIKQEYLLARASYNFAKKKFTRQGELTIENASSIKKMEEAELEYQLAETNYYSCKAKLKTIGISSENLNPKNIDNTGYLVSPVSGYLKYRNIIRGSFYSETESIFCVVSDPETLVAFSVSTEQAKYIRDSLKIAFSNTIQASYLIKEISANNLTSKIVVAAGNKSFRDGEILPSALFIPHKKLKIPANSLIENKYIILQKPDKSLFLHQLSNYIIDSEYLLISWAKAFDGNKILIKKPYEVFSKLQNQVRKY
ncbi:MAG: hypothetical protein JXA77_00755 [Bacteroidales bacterium]|nr:hypothetical protein [Bacteroidales bacterium]MBN2820802.1 hypothetical protein [Bacteroidales bacterium]